MKNCCNVRETLDTFCELSGQKVSLAKSKVYFSPNIRQEERDEMCEVLGMSSTPNLGKYLGIPLNTLGHRHMTLILFWREYKLSFRVGKLAFFLWRDGLFSPNL